MSAAKIGGNTTILLFWTTIFQNRFTLWHIRLNIYIWKTKFSSHKQYLFDLLLSRNVNKTHTDQSNQSDKLFYSVWNETSRKPLKLAAAKSSFPSVFAIDTTCFDECFLFLVITGRHYFLYKFIATQSVGTTAMLLRSLKQVFWKNSAVYIHYLHSNISLL